MWAFGVVLYDFITGRPPFRSATEFLTFQKVLHRELTYPDGFDEQAKSLIDGLLDLDPTKRPTAHEVKSHPFFSKIDWSMLWTATPPAIHTGLFPPQASNGQASLDPEVWAAFEDEESDDDFADQISPDDDFDDDFAGVSFPRQQSPLGSIEDLDPPRPAWLDEEGNGLGHPKKVRGWSTSSSSSGGRLSAWLENMGINTPPNKRSGSSRASRYSDRSDERGRTEDGTRSPRTTRSRASSPATNRMMGVNSADNSRWWVDRLGSCTDC